MGTLQFDVRVRKSGGNPLGRIVGKPSNCPKRQPTKESLSQNGRLRPLPNFPEAGCNCLILEVGRHLVVSRP